MNAACLTPYVFTRVRVPVSLSASLSVMSLVTDPPIKKHIAINPIVKGRGCNAFPKKHFLTVVVASK